MPSAENKTQNHSGLNIQIWIPATFEQNQAMVRPHLVEKYVTDQMCSFRIMWMDRQIYPIAVPQPSPFTD